MIRMAQSHVQGAPPHILTPRPITPHPKVLGTPTPDLLAKFKRNGAAHVNFDFPDQKGIGLSQLIPHAAPECVDLMQKMLAYDAAERMSAREGLQHAYFRDVRELEARRQQQGGGAGEDGGASNVSKSKSGRSTNRSESDAGGGGGSQVNPRLCACMREARRSRARAYVPCPRSPLPPSTSHVHPS